jgi:hypothetical protein
MLVRVARCADRAAHLEVYEPEGAVVRRIFRDYVENNLSMRQITWQLNQDLVPSPSGKPVWGVSTIGRLTVRRCECAGAIISYINFAARNCRKPMQAAAWPVAQKHCMVVVKPASTKVIPLPATITSRTSVASLALSPSCEGQPFARRRVVAPNLLPNGAQCPPATAQRIFTNQAIELLERQLVRLENYHQTAGALNAKLWNPKFVNYSPSR